MNSDKTNITLRQDKFAALSHQEMDKNFIELKNVIDDVAQLDETVYGAVPYVSGIVIRAPQQLIIQDGIYYQAAPSVELPFTTTNWGADQGSFVSVGDAVLRGDLSLLSGIKDLKPIVGIVQNVKGFYQGSDVGGGQFYYDPDKPKSEHNGGTVIAPEALADWDGSHGGLADYLGWSGSGLGCYVIKENSNISPENFGAIGDGNLSDVSALNKCYSSEVRIIPRDNAVYLLDDEVRIINKNISISDSNARYKYLGNTAILSFEYSYSNLQAVSELDNTAQISMTDGTGATLTRVTKLTVSDGSVFQAGDIVKVVADDILWGTNPTDSERVGEHAVIYSVSGNEIFLDRILVENNGNYTTNIRLAKGSSKQCDIGKFKVDGNRLVNTNRSLSHVRVLGCHKLKMSGIDSTSTQGALLRVFSCYQPKLGEFNAQDGKTKASVGAFAHVVLFTACSDFYVKSVVGRDMRHCVDTSAVSATVNDSNIWRYGGVVGGYCESVFGIGSQASPASTHNDADNIKFGSVVNINPVMGPNGGYSAVGFRGRNCHADYIDSDGGTGLSCFTDEAVPDNSRDHTAGRIVIRSKGKWDLCRGVRVSGQAGSVIPTVIVDSIIFKSDGFNKSFVAQALYGSVYVNKVTVEGSSENNNRYLFNSSVQGSIEINEMIGINMGTFSLANLTDSSSRFILTKANIETNQEWGYLANLNDADAFLRVGMLTVNKRGANTDLIQNRGTNANTLADWNVTEQNSSTRNRMRLETINANSINTIYSIDLSDRGCPVIYSNINTTATGCAISFVSDGKFYGQELVIVNRSNSTENLNVLSSSSGVLVGSTVVLEPGRSLRVFWDGFDWRSAG